MTVSRIRANAVSSSAQVILSTVILFLLYRYLVDQLGVELVGVWSITVAVSSLGRIGELGLSGAVTRHVASDLAISNPHRAAVSIQTAILSVALLVAFSLGPAYLVVGAVLEYTLPQATLSAARGILILVFVYVWVSAVVGLLQAGLDGCHRLDLRNAVVAATMLIFLCLALWLVPVYGLLGLAYAQLLQSCFALCASWYLLRKQLSVLPIFPFRWRYERFRQLICFGLNFQLANLATLLCDPVTKALLSKFGGPVLVGYYEMASRLVLQVRSIVVSAMQAIVPAVAALHGGTRTQVGAFYRKAFELVAYVSIVIFCGTAIAAPTASETWLGFFSSEFVHLNMILTFGWWFNTVTVPAFFANVGTGQLVWNTLGQTIIGVLNVLLGVVFGMAFGGIGVVLGYLTALLVGSALILIQFHQRYDIRFKEVVGQGLVWLLLGGVLGAWLSFSLFTSLRPTMGLLVVVVVTLAVFLVFIVIPAWLHPMRRNLFRKVGEASQ